MTRPICVLSDSIRSNLAVLKAIASYGLEQPAGGSSSCRFYVAGTLCIMGLSLFSAVHVPAAIAQSHAQHNIPRQIENSVFHPSDDLGLPNRREPGGTR